MGVSIVLLVHAFLLYLLLDVFPNIYEAKRQLLALADLALPASQGEGKPECVRLPMEAWMKIAAWLIHTLGRCPISEEPPFGAPFCTGGTPFLTFSGVGVGGTFSMARNIFLGDMDACLSTRLRRFGSPGGGEGGGGAAGGAV